MSNSIRFDKLRFVKKLQGTDANSPEFSEKLAEAFDEALEQSQSQLATKADVRKLESKIEQNFSEVDVKLAQFKTEITSEMYKMVGFMLAGVGAIVGVMRLFS